MKTILSIVLGLLMLPLAALSETSVSESSAAKEMPLPKAPLGQLVEKLEIERELLLKLLMKYTDKHPSVVAQKSKVAKLEAAVERVKASSGTIPEKQRLVHELSVAYQRLTDLLTKFTERHPEVIQQKARVTNLEKKVVLFLRTNAKE